MSGAIKPNLVYPKEQWCLRSVTGAMANKAHWWWPSSFLGPIWGYHNWKLWPLVPKLAGIPNAKRVSSRLGDRILRPSFQSALARPSFHLTASHPPEITMQNHSLLQGLGCPPSLSYTAFALFDWTHLPRHPFRVKKWGLGMRFTPRCWWWWFSILRSDQVRTGINFMSL